MCVARLSVSLHVQLGSWPMGFLFSFLLKIRAQKRPMQWQQITGRSLKAHFTSRPALCHFLCITFEAGFLLCVFIFYFIYVPDTKDTFLFWQTQENAAPLPNCTLQIGCNRREDFTCMMLFAACWTEAHLNALLSQGLDPAYENECVIFASENVQSCSVPKICCSKLTWKRRLTW